MVPCPAAGCDPAHGGLHAVRFAGEIARNQGFAMRLTSGNRYYRGPASDHFDGQRFFNPDGVPPGGLFDLLRWQLSGRRARWPAQFPSPYPPAKPVSRLDGDAVRITMVGHATLLVQTAGLNILTDPVWSPRASPLAYAGPRRVNPPGIAFGDLPAIDLVLLTHNHYDHCDIATLRRLAAAHDPLVVTPLGNDAIVGAAVPGLRVVTLDWGGRVEVGPLAIHAEPVHHWSARRMGDRCHALWAAFHIAGPAGGIYHVGDTGFHGGRHYRQLAERHGPVRLALLPFGAIEPRWFMAGQHQDPDEAVEGMVLCQARQVAGHHWATFQLTDEAIDEPRRRLHAALDRRGIPRERFRPMLPGEVWDVPP